jgi:beta-phosphoglucomutase
LISACIFDLDGVIVDTAHYHYQAWKRLAKELGFDLTVRDNERLKGVSRNRSLEIILEIGGLHASEAEKERLASKKNAWFIDLVEQMRPGEIFPGVRDLIKKLKSEGYHVALASSSKNARMVVKRLQIAELFEVMVDGTDIIRTKPDPEIFLKTAQLIDIAPQNCLVFEDAEAGVEAALAAGMKCVGVGSAAQLGKANMVVAKTGEFKIEMLTRI